MVGVEGIEGGAPAAVGQASACKEGFLIHVVTIRMATVAEVSLVVLMSKISGGIGHGTVGNGIFHIVSHTLVVKVRRNETILLADVLGTVVQHNG